MSAQVSLAIVTSVLGLLAAGILALVNGWIRTRAGIDENLRSQSLEHYPPLWSATRAVSRWPRVPLTREKLDELQWTLRCWYYAEGGLFLSGPARERYGDVQELITTLLTHNGDSAHVVVRDKYTDLMETASALRTALTQDLDTRRRKSVWETWRRRCWNAKAAKQAKERISRAKKSAPTRLRRGNSGGRIRGWYSHMSRM